MYPEEECDRVTEMVPKPVRRPTALNPYPPIRGESETRISHSDVKTAENLKRTPIAEQLDGFGALNDELTQVVERLEKKIDPILEPEPPQTCGEAKDQAILVPFASVLKQQNLQLYVSIARLRSILRRVAL